VGRAAHLPRAERHRVGQPAGAGHPGELRSAPAPVPAAALPAPACRRPWRAPVALSPQSPPLAPCLTPLAPPRLAPQAGNVFIGVQPLLGVEGDPMRLLFERDLTPHPQYAAFYKWLQHGYGADVVLHFGMHGTVEWLPGARRRC
jgi:hypothetical protein